MRTNKLLPLVACLSVFTGSLAFAEYKLGDYTLNTTVKVGYEYAKGDRDSALASQYRDDGNHVIGGLMLDADKGDYRVGFSADRIGLLDQSYLLEGTHVSGLNYQLFYNGMIHNISFGAKTPFSGVGTQDLTYTPVANRAQTNPDLWTETFDYFHQTKDYGAQLNFAPEAPYFVGLGFVQSKADGRRIFDTNSGIHIGGSSPMGFAIEMPETVDYKTNSFTTNFGYNGSFYSVAFDGMLSKFDNALDYQTFRDPFLSVITGGTDPTIHRFSLPPDNTYWKLGMSGNVRELPLDSTFVARASYSKISNTVNLWNEILATGTGGAGTVERTPITLSENTFNGQLNYGTASVALNSAPVDNLETKLYYNFLRKWNKSNVISFTSGTSSVSNLLFGYFKHNYGLDVDYRLPFDTKIGVGYEYLKVHRDRHDAETSKDDIFYGEVKNSSLDFMTARVKYTHLTRKAELALDLDALTGDARIWRGLRLFDATNKKQDKVLAGLDFTPMEHLDFAVEGSYKVNKYEETTYGRTKDNSYEAYADLSYEFPQLMTVSAFGSYEKVKIESAHRNFAPGDDPMAEANTNGNYRWTSALNDKVVGYGVGVDVPVTEALKFGMGWERQKSDGLDEYATTRPNGTTINLENSDDYTRNIVRAKATYAVLENLSAIVGYTYDRLNYNDDHLGGYTYYRPNNGNAHYFTGADRDRTYTAHIGFVGAEYRF